MSELFVGGNKVLIIQMIKNGLMYFECLEILYSLNVWELQSITLRQHELCAKNKKGMVMATLFPEIHNHFP